MSLTIQIPVTTEHYLRENATREGMSLERYIAQLLTATSISNKKKKKPLSEPELLKHIQLDVKVEDLQMYISLKEHFKSGKLNEQERETLIQLNELIEIAHAKRMVYIAELAKLRHISLEKAMLDLGVKHVAA